MADQPIYTVPRRRLPWLLLGILLGAVLILGLRFALYSPHETHYHANFAVYINGQQETFKDPTYYEEVQLCSLHGSTPKSRTHMHDEDPGVVHVHDEAVTWGQLFENLGWSIGPDFIRTKTTIYGPAGTAQLHVLLNGQDLTDQTDIAGQVIEDKDRLLLSYGEADAASLEREYKTVPNNAAQFDSRPDPASCAGAEKPGWQDRLQHLLS